MTRSAGPESGGIVFRLLLSAALVAGGAALWHAWRSGRLGGSAAAGRPEAPGAGWAVKAARLQGDVRALLTESGLGESHVLKAYTRERAHGPDRWPEETLELRPPEGFDADLFRRKLKRVLRRNGLGGPEERRRDGRWSLEMGEGGRVYERIEFHWGASASRNETGRSRHV